MKKYISFILLAYVFCFGSCSDFLEEDPQNFENAPSLFTTTKGFNAALNGLHAYARLEFQTWNDNIVTHGACPYETLQAGTDICILGMGDGSLKPFEEYSFNSSNSYIANRWKWAYGLITNANQMNNYAEKNENIRWDKETDREQFQANARFFRAYAYRYLVYLYGDVPWVTVIEENYRTDFERTPKAEVLKNMIDDLEFAAKYLPENPASVKDGQLTKWAALHLLSEICNFAGDYKRAETAALEVINSGYYQLMKNRYGAEVDKPGDVFSDMFKNKNHNRGGGNMESIWVQQAEYNTTGGGDRYTDWTRRAWVPAYYNNKGFIISAAYGGRGLGQIKPAEWWLNSYESNDIRNSEYNIRREYYYNDPSQADLYGKKHEITENDLNRGNCYPTTTKFDYGLDNDPTFEGNMKDKYRFRLAETYLLLAEAYINQGEAGKAADAINVVRERAGATAVASSSVDMDYLLDERARELLGEEIRRFTLVRTGKLIERTKKYNSKSGSEIQDFNLLWPVPQGIIDSNSGLKWENNSGYK
ncbi:MAG: RagB/SusD family nutrient uptake outer membrane protein [Dysgonomonas sp.]|nr:RagB/SusD family nutrient uptake outer membrane protein [Dysgonomonas sp.]